MKYSTSNRSNRNMAGAHKGKQGYGKRGNGKAGTAPPRRNPRQAYDDYLALARAAEVAGDIVTRENYYQHAEHYRRLLNADDGDTV